MTDDPHRWVPSDDPTPPPAGPSRRDVPSSVWLYVTGGIVGGLVVLIIFPIETILGALFAVAAGLVAEVVAVRRGRPDESSRLAILDRPTREIFIGSVVVAVVLIALFPAYMAIATLVFALLAIGAWWLWAYRGSPDSPAT